MIVHYPIFEPLGSIFFFAGHFIKTILKDEGWQRKTTTKDLCGCLPRAAAARAPMRTVSRGVKKRLGRFGVSPPLLPDITCLCVARHQ